MSTPPHYCVYCVVVSMNIQVTPVVHGGVTPVVHGCVTPVVHGGVTPVVHGGVTPVVHGGVTPVVHGCVTPVVHGGVTQEDHVWAMAKEPLPKALLKQKDSELEDMSLALFKLVSSCYSNYVFSI